MRLSPGMRGLRRAVALCAIALTAAALYPGAAGAAWADDRAPRVASGDVAGWGFNMWGEVGDGTTTSRTTPVRVCAPLSQTPCTQYLSHAADISAGSVFSVGLLRDGSVLSWGSNSFAYLGDGTTVDRHTPGRVCAVGQTAPCTRFLTGIHSVAAGTSDSMALGSDGSVVAWGNNDQGELGDGTTTQRPVPVRVCEVGQTAPCTRYLDHIREISPGGLLSLALRDDGTALAWGWNYDGQLGDGTRTQRLTPVHVCAVGQTAPCSRYLSGVRSVAAGLFNSAALLADGSVVTWGFNGHGELGDGTFRNSSVPVHVCAVGQTAPCTRYLTGVRAISANNTSLLALMNDGTVVGWGRNNVAQLGNGEFSDAQTVPVRVCAIGERAPCARYLDGVRQIDAAGGYGLAVRFDGTAVGWGYNDDGELGDGTTTLRPTPVRVCAGGQTAPCTRFLSDIEKISGNGHSFALLGPAQRRR